MGSEGFEPPKRMQQIYSLPPLTTWVTARNVYQKNKAGERDRTPDLLITNQLLYQLSYASIGTLKMCCNISNLFSKGKSFASITEPC